VTVAAAGLIVLLAVTAAAVVFVAVHTQRTITRVADATMAIITDVGSPADWAAAERAAERALTEAWPHLADDPVHAEQLAAVAVRAALDTIRAAQR
jgi:hypothetical protein